MFWWLTAKWQRSNRRSSKQTTPGLPPLHFSLSTQWRRTYLSFLTKRGALKRIIDKKCVCPVWTRKKCFHGCKLWILTSCYIRCERGVDQLVHCVARFWIFLRRCALSTWFLPATTQVGFWWKMGHAGFYTREAEKPKRSHKWRSEWMRHFLFSSGDGHTQIFHSQLLYALRSVLMC